MGTEGSTRILEETLAVFTDSETVGTPRTTSEVAEHLDCARRTAYDKLETLADQGALETKKVGARGRVWWRPIDDAATTEAAEDLEGGQGTALEEAQFTEFVEAVTDYAIFVLDPDGHIRTWNEGARQVKGYDEDEITGEHVSTFYIEEDREAGRAERNLEKAIEEDRVEDEGWRVRKDGSTFWANVTITAIRGDDDDVRGFIKVTRDMTDRHAYEEQLRTEKERFETLVREVKDYAIFLLAPDGTVQTWNEGARQVKGYDEDEIIGEHVSTFYTEEDREAGRPERNLERAREDGRVEDEGWRVRKDGTTFWANVTITALYEDDELHGFAKVTRDMTERHEYEEQLLAQRDELNKLNQINAVIRDIDQALVTATTREEIEQAVCDRLAASSTFTGAWTAEYTEEYEEITPRAWAGIGESYLEAIREADAATEHTERGVGAAALRSGAAQPVQELHADRSGEPWRDSTLAEGYASAITVPLSYNDVEYGVVTVYADTDSAFDERTIAVMRELGETISHAIAAIRRKERAQTLTALQASTRDLLHAETPGEIGEIIVDTLTADLELADAVVYYFDTADNVLDPVSSSYEAEAYTSQVVPLTAGMDSPVWESFMDGESTVGGAVLPATDMGDRDTMVAPLGDHGVLAVATVAEETVDQSIQHLVQLVAATAEAAFDRLESQATLRERDELLQAQNQRLQRLNQINTIIREVDQGLVQASTREEIQRVVCDRLTNNDRFRFAWIGQLDEMENTLVPRAWEGTGRGYLDSVDLTVQEGKSEAEPAVRTTDTGEVTVIENVAEQLREGQWRREAFSREFQSVICVPLQYDDLIYGVLSVYADRPEVFGEMDQTVFVELGETVANAINAIDTKQALLHDQAVELEFHLREPATSALANLAGELDADVSVDGMVPVAADSVRLFLHVHDATAGEVEAVFEQAVTVESSQVLSSLADGCLVEAVISGRSIPLTLEQQGAALRSLSVTAEGIRLLVDLPSSADVREFIERFQTQYESAEFVARRERERPLRTPDDLYATLEEELTDRQLEVLQTAYLSGYFSSPRLSTGGDVAELLDVSQPTITEQLRAAQSTLLELVFADASLDG